MKLIKRGTKTLNENGGYTFTGYEFDCEGGPVNLDIFDEIIHFEKLMEMKENKLS